MTHHWAVIRMLLYAINNKNDNNNNNNNTKTTNQNEHIVQYKRFKIILISYIK